MKNESFFYMVRVAQLVRASDCGSEGRGFEPHLAPLKEKARVIYSRLFFWREVFQMRYYTSLLCCVSEIIG